MAAAPPFKVKALYPYSSEHEDDLNFAEGQIITVTEIEDDDWYIGEYTSGDGSTKSGLFPNNFVERYEPAPPPRPTRQSRPKSVAEPTAMMATTPASAVASSDEPAPPTMLSTASKPNVEEEGRGQEEEPEEQPATASRKSVDAPPPQSGQESTAESSPPVLPAATKPVPPPSAPEQPRVQAQQPPPAPKPEPAEPIKATPAKKPPPPVAEKSSSFKDKLAAFNKQGAAPIAPFKPPGSSANAFIKKPFVAPPPSRNAYVPPITRNEPPPKVYRREEDPEIAARMAEDEEAAEKAGLTAGSLASQQQTEVAAEGGEEDAPKPVSLKERIALLQKQQQEQAARRAESSHKKKPERPQKKRAESHEGAAAQDTGANVDQQPEGAERAARDPEDVSREAPVRKTSRPPAVPRDREASDGNEADQSAAGETTEDAGHDSSTEEDGKPPRPTPVSKAAHAEAEDGESTEEGEQDEDEDEDELDEETRRQQALRERMAKLSGGMGMGPMFGPPGGMVMPGMGGIPAKKKKPPPAERKPAEEAAEESMARAPMVPIPGIGLPGMMARSMSSESGATLGKEDSGRTEEGEAEAAVTASQAAPSPPATSRAAPPPIPGGRPSMEARAPPPPPPAQQMTESEGSEADDEIAERSGTELPMRGAPPPVPSHVPQPSNRMSMDSPTLPQSPTSPMENKRASRIPPPIPVTSPTMIPPAPMSATSRAPPPPPPTQAPNSRQGTIDSTHRKALSGIGAPESGSEYEGDYDTDIASGEKHKDALKSHARDPSLDESLSMDTPVRSPPLPHSGPYSPTGGPRGVPPLPPTAPPASRKSAEHSRAPPPIPSRTGDDDEYDPFNYASTPAVAARSPPPPPAPAHRQPPPLPTTAPAMPAPPVPPRQESEDDDDEDEDELYSQPPPRKSADQPRKSMDRPPPPLPPQAPPSHDRAPPPLPPQAAPHGHFDAPPPALPHGKAPGRPSMDQDRSFAPPSRTSTDPIGRPSMSGHRPEMGDFIARDIDLAEGSLWWTQPNMPPPAVQNRVDVGFEIEESTSTKRGGKTIVSKDVYLLYQDYSQTVVTARFDASQPQDAHLEQKHEPPPNKLRQDQLENFWTRYGASISKTAEKSIGGSAVGDGSAHAFILELLKNLPGSLAPVGTRAYGALVYANLGNATVQQFDEIRPGDVVSFRNAKFQGKHGGLHTKYSIEVGGHVGVVVEWDGTKKKLRVAEQGRDMNKEKKKDKKGKVEMESYRLEDLRSGEVRVWRVVGREYVGWDSGQ
ncbi:uncharacterized protein PV09_03155 [Verruconis gallopava]|uniref:SH3 domain-containing protein n=1 Tax=Verruconis gallopava TaxID=253628 RepID=A0A0D2AHE4_9PEZI|nr:uncharacterized protein PV09_03155 [Verruconis gallopava]KIW05970.1 hypothetical protein PV09_03155 [Verruconis gallopava]